MTFINRENNNTQPAIRQLANIRSLVTACGMFNSINSTVKCDRYSDIAMHRPATILAQNWSNLFKGLTP